MPGIRESAIKKNIKGALTKQDEHTVSTIPEHEEHNTDTASPFSKRPSREYSARSPILKAYQAGQMPIDHQLLLQAIKRELGDGVQEGTIQLEKVLQATGYLRASALKMLHHMQNFGVLETEPRYRATWVKLLRE